jgi:IS1 family transposase
MNVLSREQQLSILHLIVEGNSLRSITRLTGVHRTTTLKLLVRVGAKCQAMLGRWMRNLTLEHIEVDEIWTFVLKKQARIPVTANDEKIGDQYLFFGIDEDTKLIPTFALGKRNKETTDLLAERLAACLVLPAFRSRGPVPQVSTDGWRAYPDSLATAFDGRLTHGVLVKDYRNTDMPGRYGPPEMVGADRQVVQGPLEPSDICTSHVERANLSVRTFLKRFTRLALGFSKKFENLEATIALFVAHYNFCRWHGTLGKTPAMAAKITGHPWSLAEMIDEAESE